MNPISFYRLEYEFRTRSILSLDGDTLTDRNCVERTRHTVSKPKPVQTLHSSTFRRKQRTGY